MTEQQSISWVKEIWGVDIPAPQLSAKRASMDEEKLLLTWERKQRQLSDAVQAQELPYSAFPFDAGLDDLKATIEQRWDDLLAEHVFRECLDVIAQMPDFGNQFLGLSYLQIAYSFGDGAELRHQVVTLQRQLVSAWEEQSHAEEPSPEAPADPNTG